MKKFLRILPLLALFALPFADANAAVFAVNEANNKAFLETKFGADNLEEFVKMSPRDIAEATGEKLSFKEKLAVKLVQRKVKRQLKKGERVDLNASHEKAASNINILGFLLGFVLGLIGVLIAFLIDRDLLTSSLYGLLVWLALVALVILL